MNLERIRTLIKERRMTRAGLDAVSHAFKPHLDNADDFRIPVRILNAIKKDKSAWVHFQALPARYRRIRVAYIVGRKRHSEGAFKSSLDHFIRMTAAGKRFGFVRE
ncbi:Bacteriocin-protection, YdeI or OmpD-Associated [uncultured archaeon]|nr:Bacteriocin-protection, YdeI or OmpD-Associated [uncultured archaeon]